MFSGCLGKLSVEGFGWLFKQDQDLRYRAVHNKGLTPLPMDGRSPRGFRVDDELLPVFERVKRGLTSKRKTKLFHVAVADLLARVDLPGI